MVLPAVRRVDDRLVDPVAADPDQGFPLRPMPDAPDQLLAIIRELFHALQAASPAERPFLERDIRAYADRYRACASSASTL